MLPPNTATQPVPLTPSQQAFGVAAALTVELLELEETEHEAMVREPTP